MRFLVSLLFLAGAAAAEVGGVVAIRTDSLPAELYFDGRLLIVEQAEELVPAAPGQHFVSYFPPRKVYQAFRDETPDQFWTRLRQQGAISESRRMLSSYERGAVRAGTKWLYLSPDDTVPVQLSYVKVQETYRRDSSCVLGSLLGWTLIVGAGMIASLILVKLE